MFQEWDILKIGIRRAVAWDYYPVVLLRLGDLQEGCSTQSLPFPRESLNRYRRFPMFGQPLSEVSDFLLQTPFLSHVARISWQPGTWKLVNAIQDRLRAT
jgi:hypothetical protein